MRDFARGVRRAPPFLPRSDRQSTPLPPGRPTLTPTPPLLHPPPNPPGIPASDLRLSYGGRPLTPGSSLAAAGVEDAATLEALARLLGGAKKRKKKTYTKPKKQKHKHRKVKLGVLKFFKVDDAGKVERLRQACPSCGPATFMAKHFDRVYCGKCHATYMVEGGGAAAAGGKKGKK